MTTPRSLLYAATYADPELPRVINAYRAEMAEAEMCAGRAVRDAIALAFDPYQQGTVGNLIARDFYESALRAIIEKARREE